MLGSWSLPLGLHHLMGKSEASLSLSKAAKKIGRVWEVPPLKY